MKNPLLKLTGPDDLPDLLEEMLRGYLHYAFQIGIEWPEAMERYEAARYLIDTLREREHGNNGDQAAA